MGKKKKKSGKGSLIKGMSNRIPSHLLSEPVFKVRLKEIMKGYAGVYALYNNKDIYYVGLTTNLFNRIRWHMKDRHSRKWDSFVICRIKKVNYLKDLETLIINLFDLPGNRSKGRVPKDADIGHMLRVILRQHKKEIRGIEKALKR